MKKKITLLPGDGIGREVIQAAKAILEVINKQFKHEFTFEYGQIGHAAIEESGEPLTDETLEICLSSDAILLGAVGDPKYDKDPSLKIRPEQGLLKLRKALGLYNNIRPIQLFDELIGASSLKPEVIRGADIVFFRELTGGIYFGKPRGRTEDRNEAWDTMRYSKSEVERIAHAAFRAAQRRQKRICSVDKANVLESSRLWRETVSEVAKQYSEIQLTHMFIDNAAMQLIRDPKQFDVVLTSNMFGDILTDAASQISGSLGLLPSASLGDSIGVYEPIHGSAPDIAHQNKANPMAMILSVAMMLEYSFELTKEAKSIFHSIKEVIKNGYRTQDLATSETPEDKIFGTKEMTEKIIQSSLYL